MNKKLDWVILSAIAAIIMFGVMVVNIGIDIIKGIGFILEGIIFLIISIKEDLIYDD